MNTPCTHRCSDCEVELDYNRDYGYWFCPECGLHYSEAELEENENEESEDENETEA